MQEGIKRVILLGIAFAICILLAKRAFAYSEDDLYDLSHITYAEGGNCGWFMMISVASVVENRKNSPDFPDTYHEVIFQEGQYAPTWDGSFWNDPSAEAIEAAKYVLENGTQIDESVVWQAEFPQGNGIYDTIESPFGTTMYFCY